jgi:TetR/AcrR family transcriptional regulator
MQRTLHRARHAARERDAETAREALLDAAQEIFARDGFSGARVDDIAQRAGYNKAMIFHYFDDKLGLYRALMLRTKQYVFLRFEEAYQRIFAGNGEVVTGERIAALAAAYLDALFDLAALHPETVRILAWEAAEGWQTFASCVPSMPVAWAQRVVALLERAQAAGIVRPDLDPRLLFSTLVSLPLIHLTSLPRFAVMFPDTDFTSPDAIAHARDQLTDLVLRGILCPHAPDPKNLATIHSQTTLAHSQERA